ncbi:MAG: plastocyanin/azurin family copper-binding protein [Actinomycetota bacterium]
MHARRIRRVLTEGAGLALVALVALALVPGVAGASGGGGCGGPVTDGAGTTVEIEDFCFGPTILRVAPGESVTFVNLDQSPHTVLGANATWGGYDALKKGHEATYTFAEAGVFPYVCTWHPGMVGAIVVGDGAGGAIETNTADGPVTRTSPLTDVELAGGRPADPEMELSSGLIVVFVLLAIIAVTVFLQRRRGSG